jgi:hypothetical protein
MTIRVGWLPTGTQSAEDTRALTGALLTPAGLVLALAGVVPATSNVAAPFALASTGSLSCSVGPGQVIMVPGLSTYQGPYPVTVDASGSGLPTVSFAAGGSLARTDVIYVQVEDTAEDGSGQTKGLVAVQQGTNGGGVPSVPSGAFALWNVPVPASATSITFSTATFVGTTTVALGGVIPSNGASMPAHGHVGQTRARYDRTGITVPGPLEVFDGTTWNPAVPASFPRGSQGAPISATANGTASSGTVDTIDTVFGTYQFTAVAGRRYRAVMTGLVCNGSVLNDVFALRIRDSNSASTPTTASTAVVDTTWECDTAAGSSGRMIEPIEDTWIAATSGTHTLGFFAQRVAGTGVFTPLSSTAQGGTGARKLIVEDIGNV